MSLETEFLLVTTDVRKGHELFFEFIQLVGKFNVRNVLGFGLFKFSLINID